MDFSIIFYGFLLFFICLSIHVIIWRLYHSKRQIFTLFSLFISFPLLFHVFIYNFDIVFNVENVITKNLLSLNTGEFLLVYLLFYALSLAYIFSYPAAQAGCPSFIILLIIESSKRGGITREGIHSYCLGKKLFGLRVYDLVDENLVIDKDGWFELTKKGLLISRVFIILRKLFNLPLGKG